MKKILEGIFIIITTALAVIFLSIDFESLTTEQAIYIIVFLVVSIYVAYQISKFFNDNLNNKA